MEHETATYRTVGAAPIAARAAAVERPAHLLTLSADTTQDLMRLVEQSIRYLHDHPDISLPHFCFTTNTNRTHRTQRLVLFAESTECLLAELESFRRSGTCGHNSWLGQAAPDSAKVVFLFTGQGGQYVGMGQQLYAIHPVFRAALDRCQEILYPYLKARLLDLIHPRQVEGGQFNETWIAQPALLALEYALAQVWLSWGVRPDALIGHSLGEYTAACIAGACTLEDALWLAAERGRLMQELPPVGMMVAVHAAAQQIEHVLEDYRDRLSIAALNGPANSVVSGEREAVQEAVRRFRACGLSTNALAVSHAFHSLLMEPILEPFERIAASVSFQQTRIPLVSTVTGQMIEPGSVLDAAYWREHIRAPVRFADGISTLAARGYTIFLEVGPQPVLLSLAKRIVALDQKHAWLPSIKRGQDDWRVMLKSLAQLHLCDVTIDWRAVAL